MSHTILDSDCQPQPEGLVFVDFYPIAGEEMESYHSQWYLCVSECKDLELGSPISRSENYTTSLRNLLKNNDRNFFLQ